MTEAQKMFDEMMLRNEAYKEQLRAEAATQLILWWAPVAILAVNVLVAFCFDTLPRVSINTVFAQFATGWLTANTALIWRAERYKKKMKRKLEDELAKTIP